MNEIKRTLTTWGVEADKINANFNDIVDFSLYGHFPFGELADFDLSNIPEQQESIGATENTANFNAIYDALVTAFPNYVTRIDCSQSGIAVPAYLSGLPIYIYKFSQQLPSYSEFTQYSNKPKVFITTGTHGGEKISIKSTARMMELICNAWSANKNLKDLRFNAEIYIMPCANPSGIETNSRPNYNGIDLNRNMPVKNWAEQGTQGSVYWSGNVAGSEYENKILIYYLNQIKPDIYIDYHNGGVYNSGQQQLIKAFQQMTLDIAVDAAIKTSEAWQSANVNYPSINTFNMVLVTAATLNDVYGFRDLWAYENGINLSFLIEGSNQIGWNAGVKLETGIAINNTAFTEQVKGILYMVMCSLSAISKFKANHKWVR